MSPLDYLSTEIRRVIRLVDEYGSEYGDYEVADLRRSLKSVQLNLYVLEGENADD